MSGDRRKMDSHPANTRLDSRAGVNRQNLVVDLMPDLPVNSLPGAELSTASKRGPRSVTLTDGLDDIVEFWELQERANALAWTTGK